MQNLIDGWITSGCICIGPDGLFLQGAKSDDVFWVMDQKTMNQIWYEDANDNCWSKKDSDMMTEQCGE